MSWWNNCPRPTFEHWGRPERGRSSHYPVESMSISITLDVGTIVMEVDLLFKMVSPSMSACTCLLRRKKCVSACQFSFLWCLMDTLALLQQNQTGRSLFKDLSFVTRPFLLVNTSAHSFVRVTPANAYNVDIDVKGPIHQMDPELNHSHSGYHRQFRRPGILREWRQTSGNLRRHTISLVNLLATASRSHRSEPAHLVSLIDPSSSARGSTSTFSPIDTMHEWLSHIAAT